MSIIASDIAGMRISCKPQKLQAKLAAVQIGRGSWRKVWQAGRKTWLGFRRAQCMKAQTPVATPLCG